ncbi:MULTISPECIES: type IV pilus major pilin [unclassified Providencia]|uniref:type IV pilus major pilin n=1 Tax=unclassified Providencia TaxID=2633465 RepID=UPI00234BFD09|nr:MULTISPECIES: type IV pilus major pilin [unclassified Providencia]
MNVLRTMKTRNKHKLSEKLKRYRELKKQQGMTLLEIIIVLGIIGVIAAGVVILAQRAYDSKAMTDLANNANTIRVAMKDAYGQTGQYPLRNADVTAMTPANYKTHTLSPIGKLLALGKVSVDEAQNNISSDFIDIGALTIGAKAQAGYYIQLNGLNQEQCRGLVNQMANNWDYVEVMQNAASGVYNDIAPTTDIATGADTLPTTATPAAVLRSLAHPNQISADTAVFVCENSSENALVLGSR